jgi:hypothetical protein
VLSKHIPDAIEGGTDEERVRASVAALNKQREREWEQGIGPDVFEEQRRPTQELKYGRGHGSKTLKEATDDITAYHRMQKPDVRLALERFGGDPETVAKLARDPEFARAYGLTPQQADEWARTGELPPFPVGVIDEKRGLRDRIADHENIYEREPDELFKNPRDATRQQGNFREALAGELTRQELARQEAEALALQQAGPAVGQTPTGEAAAAAPVEQPAEQPKVDPVAIQIEKLNAERQAYHDLHRLSAVEQDRASQINAWYAAFNQAYPWAGNKDAVAEVGRTNPNLLAQAQQALQHINQQTAPLREEAVRAQRDRLILENQVAEYQHAETRARWHTFKDQQDAIAHQHIPELNDTTRAAALRDATKNMLRGVGFQDAELAHAWDGRSGFSLRDGRVQQVLADAARYRQMMANKNAIASKRAPVPSVQRPGVARPRGADSEADIQRLERQLDHATGERAALRVAMKLTQARRAGGRL